MFNISAYLEKFKKLGQSDRVFKEVFILVIKEVVGVVLEDRQVTIKNGEVFLNVSPGIKNAVFIKKDLILSKVKEKNGQNVLNIR